MSTSDNDSEHEPKVADAESDSPIQKLIAPHEKRILEAHIRGVPLNRLALDERVLNEYEQEDLKNLIRMRMRGVPLQYLIGTQAFYGREFYVNTSVLIPRPETETLVELTLKELPAPHSETKLYGLDFGTGSGCIALTLAMERPDSIIAAVEASADAIKVAEENARKHRVTNVNIIPVSETPQLWQFDDLHPLDFIVSNPPYLMPEEELAQDVREHEPPEALFPPDEDPLYFYKFLAELMEQKLALYGFAIFEIAEQRSKETAAIFESKNFKTSVHQDLTGRDRYLLVKRS